MIWPVNFHQVSTFLEKVTFWDYCENELIFLGYVLKSPSMLGGTPQGLLFPRNIHSCRIYWCPSAAECKSSLYFSISRGFFEGRCHQVPKITIQNGPRQLRRSTGGVMGSSNPRPLEPLQINPFGEKSITIIEPEKNVPLDILNMCRFYFGLPGNDCI